MPKKESVIQSVTNAILDQKLVTLASHVEELARSVKDGFLGVHNRQDVANGRTSTNEKELALLKAFIEKEFATRDAKSKYNRVIWYTLTTTISVIIALTSFIVLK
jgi:hypothetical protein